MKNKKYHEYILKVLIKFNDKYNKNIILYYRPKCNRSNITFNEKQNKHCFEYGDRLIENSKLLKSNWKYQLNYVCLHEFGHIFHKTDKYETLQEKTIAEYKAERFALNRLKEYYPNTYKWVCAEGTKMLKDKKWAICNSEYHYRLAWLKIKEYIK